MLADTKMLAPAYFILGGVTEVTITAIFMFRVIEGLYRVL